MVETERDRGGDRVVVRLENEQFPGLYVGQPVTSGPRQVLP